MQDHDAHPGVRFERAVGDAWARARAARIALGVTLASRVYLIAVNAARLTLVREAHAGIQVDLATLRSLDQLAHIGELSRTLLFWGTAVLFVRWLWIAVQLARELVHVVGAVAARLAERFRRVRYNPVDVLREAGLEFAAAQA
jgi:hypothetical protein